MKLHTKGGREGIIPDRIAMDIEVRNRIASLAEDKRPELYDKEASDLRKHGEISSLIRIAKAKDDREFAGKEDCTIARKTAITLLGKMNSKKRNGKIEDTLADLISDKESEIRMCAVSNLSQEKKEEIAESLIEEIKIETDLPKRLVALQKLNPLIDEKIEFELEKIYKSDDSEMLKYEIDRIFDKLSLN